MADDILLRVGAETEAAADSLESLGERGKRSLESIDQAAQAVDLTKLERTADAAGDEMGELAAKSTAAAAGIEQQGDAARRADVGVDQLRAGLDRLEKENEEVKRALAETRAELARLEASGGKNLTGLNEKAGKLLNTLRGFAVAAITAGAVKLGRETLDAIEDQEKALNQARSAVESTGKAAGFSAEQLAEMAGGFQKLTTFADEVVLSTEAMLLRFTRISGETFPRTVAVVLDLATRLDGDLKGAVTAVGKALDSPDKGLQALERTAGRFSESLKEQIKTQLEANNVAGAQTLILGELERKFGGAAAAAREDFGGALDAAKNQAGELLEAVGEGGLSAGLKSLAKDLDTVSERRGVLDLFKSIGVAAGSVAAGIGLLAKSVPDVVALVVNQFKTIVVAAKLAGGEVAESFGSLLERISFGKIGGDIKRAGEEIAAAATGQADELQKDLEARLGSLGKSWESFTVTAVEIWEGAGQRVAAKPILSDEVVEEETEAARKVAEAYEKAAQKAAKSFGGLTADLLDELAKLNAAAAGGDSKATADLESRLERSRADLADLERQRQEIRDKPVVEAEDINLDTELGSKIAKLRQEVGELEGELRLAPRVDFTQAEEDTRSAGSKFAELLRKAIAGSGFVDALGELPVATRNAVRTTLSELERVAEGSNRLDPEVVTGFVSEVAQQLGRVAPEAAAAFTSALGIASGSAKSMSDILGAYEPVAIKATTSTKGLGDAAFEAGGVIKTASGEVVLLGDAATKAGKGAEEGSKGVIKFKGEVIEVNKAAEDGGVIRFGDQVIRIGGAASSAGKGLGEAAAGARGLGEQVPAIERAGPAVDAVGAAAEKAAPALGAIEAKGKTAGAELDKLDDKAKAAAQELVPLRDASLGGAVGVGILGERAAAAAKNMASLADQVKRFLAELDGVKSRTGAAGDLTRLVGEVDAAVERLEGRIGSVEAGLGRSKKLAGELADELERAARAAGSMGGK